MNLDKVEKTVVYEPVELPIPLQQPKTNPEPVHQEPIEVPEKAAQE